jgi:16S rRNA (cytosine967-C5)-methyltransferase
MSPRPEANARLAAVRALSAILEREAGVADEPPIDPKLDARDQAFARHLVYGVLRWLSALEWLSGQLLKKPLKRRDRDVEFLILAGLFQLWQGGTPPHAAVHATVDAARISGKGWAAGLINALLRNFLRQQEQLLADLARHPAQHAHPAWLLDQLQADWPGQWPDIVKANNSQAPLWLRVNRRLIDPAQYRELLAAAGLEARFSDEAADAILVEPAVPVSQLPGFDRGLVSVQDAAAQLAADYLDARPGDQVLDACAAPGGKSCHLLERTPGIDLTALDRDPVRAQLIRDNFQRLGLDQGRVLVGDASVPGPWQGGQSFDRILLDAPCSATGVIRRHPEIKWLRDAAQVEHSIQRQRALLDALWPLLKPGGMLVYATCSVLQGENKQQIMRFLSRHPDASPELGDGRDEAQSPGRQILPGEHDMDGFYYARLRKSA